MAQRLLVERNDPNSDGGFGSFFAKSGASEMGDFMHSGHWREMKCAKFRLLFETLEDQNSF